MPATDRSRVVWTVTPDAVFDACNTPAMRAMIDPDCRVPTPSDMRFRTAEYANVVMALLENAGTTFYSAEQATAGLFHKHWNGGGGMGIPLHLQGAAVAALEHRIEEPDVSTFAGASAAVLTALRAIGTDPGARDRIAYATTLSHAEASWVQESAYQLVRNGVPTSEVKRETAVGPHKRVDLVVGQTPVEFKSTFASFALENSRSHTTKWLGRDIEKIRAANHPGIYVVTVAQLVDVPHRRIRFARRRTKHLDAAQIRHDGLNAYSDFLESETGTKPVALQVATTHGIGEVGKVNLDVLVGQVH